MSAAQSVRTPPRPIGESMTRRQKFILLNTLMVCMFVGALDHSIMATAIPKIVADLQGIELLPWLVTTFLLASTIVVSVVGKLSDMFGRKPFLLAGIAIFVVASMACGLAPSMLALIIARTAQGAGSGIIFACVFASVGDLFTPIERVRYMAYFTSTFTVASFVGPAVGGFLTDGPGWRWCFYVNLPVGLLAAVLVWYLMPGTRRGGRLADVDFLGATLLAVGTTTFMLAVVWARQAFGFGSPETLGLFAVSLLIGIAFVLQERRHPEAILPMFLFRNRQFVQANLIVMTIGGGVFASIQFIPLFAQTSLGTSATMSGLVTTPQSVGVFVTSVIAGQLVGRTGRYKRAVVFGGVLVFLGNLAMLTLTSSSSPVMLAVFMGMIGLGLGFVMPVMSTVVQNSVPQELMGVASSSRQFFMSIVQVFGAAVLSLIFTSGYTSAFNAASDRTALPPVAYQQFQDPTLVLDAARYTTAREAVLREPDGEALLARTVEVQRESVTSATHRLFLTCTIIAGLMLAFAVMLREVPLRRTFEPAPEAAPATESA